MKPPFKILTTCAGLLTLAACSGTDNYVETPILQVAERDMAPAQALDQLFTNRPVPYRIALGEADKETGECPDIDTNSDATGVTTSSNDASSGSIIFFSHLSVLYTLGVFQSFR